MSNINPKDCLFSAELALSERSSDTAKTAPFSMVARSGQPINHHFWGPIVHDNNGAQHKKRVPIDFNHDVNEIVGFGNKIGINDEGDLEISGFLTPYKDSDRATEILAKAEMGVPWEASINFAGDMKLEKVEAGETVEVNGQEFEGPMTVVREWQLRGVAITPYGYDSSTSTQFSETSNINVTYINEEADEMKNEELHAEAPEAVEAEETQAEELHAEAPEAVEAEELHAEGESSEVEASEAEVEVEAEAPEAVDAELSVAPGQAFMDLFGETEGAVYFAKGISLEAAKDAEITRLREENAELKSRVVEVATAGEEAPVGFSAAEAKTALTSLPISIK